jgi:predicted porin
MKSMIRSAAAGLCLSAFSLAPSVSSAADTTSVTLYGLVDSGIQYVNHGPDGGSSSLDVASGNLTGSRWGMRGTEDLGGGLSTIFALESGFDNSNGQSLQGGRLFGRQAYVGLSDRTWGALMLGRQNTLVIDWVNNYNPFDNSNFGGKIVDPAFSDRMDNAAKYVKRLGGVTLGAAYSSGWNNDQDFSDAQRGKMIEAGGRYDAGPFSAALLYHGKRADAPKAPATSHNREDRVFAGVSYDFEIVKLYGGYRWLQQQLTTQVFTSNLYWAGVQYRPQSGTRLSAAFYYLDGTTCDSMNVATCPAVQGAGKDQKPRLLVLGAEHDLSKRTTLYALTSYVMNSHGSSYGILGNKSREDVTPGDNQLGVTVGMRHRF